MLRLHRQWLLDGIYESYYVSVPFATASITSYKEVSLLATMKRPLSLGQLPVLVQYCSWMNKDPRPLLDLGVSLRPLLL
jgi:hypothetical protein